VSSHYDPPDRDDVRTEEDEADYLDWFNSLDDTLGTLALAERMEREGLPTDGGI